MALPPPIILEIAHLENQPPVFAPIPPFLNFPQGYPHNDNNLSNEDTESENYNQPREQTPNIINLANSKNGRIMDYVIPDFKQLNSGKVRPHMTSLHFELKPIMFHMLQTNGQFSRLTSEDPHSHLKSFMEITYAFLIPGVSNNALRLTLFPISLRDRAKAWFNSLLPGSVPSWTVLDAWEKFKELLRKCPHHGIPYCIQLETFYNGLSSMAKQMFDATAEGAFTASTYNEGYEIFEKILANNGHWADPRAQPQKKIAGIHDVNAYTALTAQLTSMATMLKNLTPGQGVQPAVTTLIPKVLSVQCVCCGREQSYEHCPHNTEFINCVHNGSGPYTNNYNASWKQHMNFSWNSPCLNPPAPKQQGTSNFQPQQHVVTSQESERMSKIQYASATGSIMYAMICTRPDISYALSMTSRYQSNPRDSHWIAVKNILKYLRRTKDSFLVYGGEEELSVKGYTYASFQTDKDDFRSQSGFVFCLNGGAVSWKSSKQATVADFTTEAEYIAASDAAKEAVWIKKFISQLGVVPSSDSPLDYVKFLKDILSKKKNMTEYETVALTEGCSALLINKIPPKLKDPRNFTISCSIGGKEIGKALCALGASINLMPLSVFNTLGIEEARPTVVTLQLANKSIA
ncbi:uncharacterized protein LOC112506079 [Cynara cardunculus var. scolymus]|uniref:uncharacterized protein LOC112506079 n=1 Tax=Cynara cardunculus var. scolymus TaxID=59895 RepID=UPI000D630738|nr:uncharacterized protein LOC112506079 [Cynara cardunculus var. scolymus]